jgi:N utilization substance protein B
VNRKNAREYAVLTVYGLDGNPNAQELLQERLDPAFFERLADEDGFFKQPPDAPAAEYIRRVTLGVAGHLAELDAYIEKYSRNWHFGRLPRMTVALLRVCMFEVLYMSGEVPPAAAINAAVDISKKYESEEVTRFTNGVLGSFARNEPAQ